MARSAAELEQLWKDGLPLDEAVDVFTSSRPLRRRKPSPGFPNAHALQELSAAEVSAVTGEALRSVLEDWNRISEPTNRRRAELVHQIALGHLAAVGFLEGDPDNYREVPPGLMHPRHFMWQKSLT